jgi:hypothetical protein
MLQHETDWFKKTILGGIEESLSGCPEVASGSRIQRGVGDGEESAVCEG